MKLYSTTIMRPTQPQSVEIDKDMKLGVLFLNLGGPETMKDVEGFLFNLFADPDIIRLPPLLSILQKPIAFIISKRRAPKSSEAYKSIGGGSPIVKYTREQAEGIQKALQQRGFKNAKCYFAMRYWNPYTEEALDQIQKDARNTLVIVPLYPQFSISTSGSSLKLLQDIFYREPDLWSNEKVAHTVVPAWYYRPGYLKVMAQLILKEIASYSKEELAEGVHILYSAHGVPQSYIAAGDPYQRQIEECVQMISREVSRQLVCRTTRPAGLSIDDAYRLAGVTLTHECRLREEMEEVEIVKKIQPGVQKTTDATDLNDEVSTSTSSESDLSGSKEEKGFDWPSLGDVFQSAVNNILGVLYIQSVRESDEFHVKESTHSVHEKKVEMSQTGVDASFVSSEVRFHLSFQSRVGPVKWLQPYTEEKIIELGVEKNVRNLVVVPISFVSEHIETLEEIDMEYRELAEKHGIENWRRVPALNTEPAFLEDMADMVVEALQSPTLSVSEATIRNSPDLINLDSIDDETSVNWKKYSSSQNPQFNFDFNDPISNDMEQLRAGSSVQRGKFAMLGFVGTTLLEMLNNHPILQMVGLR